MSQTIVVVTGNPNKLQAIRHHTEPFGVDVVAQELPLVEPQAESIAEVALSKAEQAHRMLATPLVVEDSGFSIDALGGFPGAYTKYVLKTIGVYRLLDLVRALDVRTCRFTSALVYIDEAGEKHLFVDDAGIGTLATNVDETPCPDAWSDLWRIFVPHGANAPLSALSAKERGVLLQLWQQNSVYTRFGQWFHGARVRE